MATELAIAGLTEGIEEVVSSIFENMLGLPTSSHQLHVEADTRQEVHSVLTFTGCWHGMVSIECTCEQARHFAARFLSLPDREVGEQLACDVLGELTNMVAGNLKPLFGSEIQLSIATVGRMVAPIQPAFTPEICKELYFWCAEGNFVARVQAGRATPMADC